MGVTMNNESEATQEVTVTDIRMPFGSMVVFMVKWAVASIPALVILVVLGAVFWGITIGFLLSTRQAALGDATGKSHATAQTMASDRGAGRTAEESTYLSKVLVRNVSVGKSALDETGVFGEVKNTGDRTLKEVGITIYCLGADGKAVFEKTYRPVPVTEVGFGDSNQPLKPGYGRQFGVKMDDAPSEWTKKVDVEVTHVEFQ